MRRETDRRTTLSKSWCSYFWQIEFLSFSPLTAKGKDKLKGGILLRHLRQHQGKDLEGVKRKAYLESRRALLVPYQDLWSLQLQFQEVDKYSHKTYKVSAQNNNTQHVLCHEKKWSMFFPSWQVASFIVVLLLISSPTPDTSFWHTKKERNKSSRTSSSFSWKSDQETRTFCDL